MTVTTRSWELEHLIKLSLRQPELVERGIHKLLADDANIRWAVVVSAYMDREINLGKAAQLLGMYELDLRDRFIVLGIPLRIGPFDLDEARAEVDAVRRGFADAG